MPAVCFNLQTNLVACASSETSLFAQDFVQIAYFATAFTFIVIQASQQRLVLIFITGMFGFSGWEWRSCLFRSISGSYVFFLWRSPVPRPLVPAVAEPIGGRRALFCAPKAMPSGVGCSWTRGAAGLIAASRGCAVGAKKAEFCCQEVLFLITSLGAATRENLLGQIF